MISKEFFRNIESVADEKGLTVEQVKDAFSAGLIAGCKRSNNVRSCRVVMKEEKNEILIYKQQLVVDEFQVENEKNFTQILLEDAKKIKKLVKLVMF